MLWVCNGKKVQFKVGSRYEMYQGTQYNFLNAFLILSNQLEFCTFC